MFFLVAQLDDFVMLIIHKLEPDLNSTCTQNKGATTFSTPNSSTDGSTVAIIIYLMMTNKWWSSLDSALLV